ncbi:MAG: hypothetical protein P8P56_06830 [Yoonia sp.]|nr:hypothetical protein [Yoonia sp.]
MKLLIPLAFCLTASVASAQTCKGKDLVIIPEMEAAKDAFFEKDYEQFAELLGYSFPVPPNGAAALFAPLNSVIDGDFVRCQTILQRHESPGFYQDVVLYFTEKGGAPLALLLTSADVGGEIHFLSFTTNSSIGAVLEKLK